MSSFPEGLSLILQQLTGDIKSLETNQMSLRDKVAEMDRELGEVKTKIESLDEKVDHNHSEVMGAIQRLSDQQNTTIIGWLKDNPKLWPIVALLVPVLGSTLVALGESINRGFDRLWGAGGEAAVERTIDSYARPTT